jgi:hypothetical protein
MSQSAANPKFGLSTARGSFAGRQTSRNIHSQIAYEGTQKMGSVLGTLRRNTNQ